MLNEEEKLSHVKATDVHRNSSELLNRVMYGKETIVVQKHSKPSVVLMPYEEYVSKETILLSDRDRDLFLSVLDNPPAPTAALKKAFRRHQAKHNK